MDRKPLIGVSVFAIGLLILGTLSYVGGYQSVKSTEIDSPLFTTRTQRATNQQQIILTSQYLGMGKVTLWQVPMRYQKTEQLRKTIEAIGKMNEKAFAQFTELVIQGSRQDAFLKGITRNDIVQILHKIRTQPEATIHSLTSRGNGRLDPTNFNCASIFFYVPGCTIKLVIVVIIALLAPLLVPLIQLGNIITIIFDCW